MRPERDSRNFVRRIVSRMRKRGEPEPLNCRRSERSKLRNALVLGPPTSRSAKRSVELAKLPRRLPRQRLLMPPLPQLLVLRYDNTQLTFIPHYST